MVVATLAVAMWNNTICKCCQADSVSRCKEHGESLRDNLWRLDGEPVTILRKMFNARAAELFRVFWRDEGVFVSPQHQGWDMPGQSMETVFPADEILCIDAAIQF